MQACSTLHQVKRKYAAFSQASRGEDCCPMRKVGKPISVKWYTSPPLVTRDGQPTRLIKLTDGTGNFRY